MCFVSSSRLQPDRYRRLLGSTDRTHGNINTCSGPTTIDREPSPHVRSHSTTPDDDTTSCASESGGGDDGSGDSGGDGDGEVGGGGHSGGRELDSSVVVPGETVVRYRGRGARGSGGETLSVCVLTRKVLYTHILHVNIQH